MRDPESFLNAHLLNIAGGVFVAPELKLNLRRQLEVRKFNLWCNAERGGKTANEQLCDRLRLDLNDNAGDISMVYIPMVRDDFDPSLWWGTFAEELQKSDCDLICTSQMTGCTFGYAGENRRLHLAHVQPGQYQGAILPLQVHRLVEGAKVLAPTSFYHADKGEVLNIVGKRSGSTWSLYGQVSNRQHCIVRVEKFFEWSPVAYVD